MEISLWTLERLYHCAILHKNLEDMLTVIRWWIFLILESKVKVTIDIYSNKLVNTTETNPLWTSSSNFLDMFTMVRGWFLLISEVKGQLHKRHYSNKLVNTIELKPLCASSSNLADMFTMVRGWIQLILQVTCQRWRSWRASTTNVGSAGMLRFAFLYLVNYSKQSNKRKFGDMGTIKSNNN